MINLLTFDVEEWFQANYQVRRCVGKFEKDISLGKNVLKLLNLCRELGAGATFFVLGKTAEKHPGVVLKIKEEAHEVASHGYDHSLVYNKTREEFSADLEKSIGVLQGITGQNVRGYRAPSWSVYPRMKWFFSTLERSGIVYDSSVFPARTFLYGDRQAERFPHKTGNITEIPPSTLSFRGMRIPFSGGFYFRVFPYFFIHRGIRSLNRKGLPAVVYLHPREIDPSAPRLDLGLRDRFIHYVHIKTVEKKLRRLLESFRFCAIRDYLGL